GTTLTICRPDYLRIRIVDPPALGAPEDDWATALLGHLLLPSDCPTRALLRARVRVRPLSAHRQATTVPNAAIRSDVHQAFDVHRDFRAEPALALVVALDHATELVHVGVRQITHAKRRVNARLLYDLRRILSADAIDVRQTNHDLLIARKIDARNTSHS